MSRVALLLIVLALAGHAGVETLSGARAEDSGQAAAEVAAIPSQEVRDELEAGDRALGKGRHAEAERHFRAALSLVERALGPDHRSTLHVASLLGTSLVEEHKYAEGEAVLRGAVGSYEQELSRSLSSAASHEIPTGYATSLVQLGVALFGQKKYADAEAVLQQALKRSDEMPGVWWPVGNRARLFLGDSLTELNRADEAEPFLRRALAIFERQPGGKDLVDGVVLELVRNLKAQGKGAEASQYLRRLLGVPLPR